MSTTTAEPTLATPRNMRAAAEKHGKRVRAFDPTSGSLAGISVDAGDYFQIGEDDPLMSSDGCEPLQLIVEHNTSVLRDALTGRAIADDDGDELTEFGVRLDLRVKARQIAEVNDDLLLDTLISLPGVVEASGTVEPPADPVLEQWRRGELERRITTALQDDDAREFETFRSSPKQTPPETLAQLAGDVVDRYDEDRDLDEPIEALRDHFTLALPPTTPNGYDRRWIDAINVVLADRKTSTKRIEDIDDALWERFVGPMIDSIEDAI